MLEMILIGVGMVLVLEGLVLALAPSRFEELIAFLDEIGPEARRLMGLLCMVIGVAVLWGITLVF